MCTHTPPAKSPKNLRGYWTNVHEIFIRRRGIVVGVKATIGVAIFSSDVECQRTEWRRGVSIFPDTCYKSVTIATSLERAVPILIYCYKAHNICSISAGSLVNISSGTLVKTTQKCVFLSMCTHTLPASQPLDLRRYWTKVQKLFTRRRAMIGGVNATVRVAILTSVLKRQQRRGVSLCHACRAG